MTSRRQLMVAESWPRVPWRRVAPAAAAAIDVPGLTDPVDLGGSPRTHVWRCRSGDTAYVVKVHRDAENTAWAREPCGLQALQGRAPVPVLLGVADDPRLHVMADLGAGPSLADRVLAADPVRAEEALDAWVDAIAALHAASRDEVQVDFAASLDRRLPGADVDTLPASFAEAARTYVDLAPTLGVDPTAAADALAAYPGRLAGPRVLTPQDTCPDNNVIGVDGGMTLIDFEGASLRHPAWDLAYLRVPWPTCWCAWALPDEVAARGVARYRAARATPWATSPSFADDLEVAVFGWCLLTPAWFLEAALDRRPAATGAKQMPGRRTMVLHRLALAGCTPGPEPLRTFATALREALVHRWGDLSLPTAPAWRPPSGA